VRIRCIALSTVCLLACCPALAFQKPAPEPLHEGRTAAVAQLETPPDTPPAPPKEAHPADPPAPAAGNAATDQAAPDGAAGAAVTDPAPTGTAKAAAPELAEVPALEVTEEKPAAAPRRSRRPRRRSSSAAVATPAPVAAKAVSSVSTPKSPEQAAKPPVEPVAEGGADRPFLEEYRQPEREEPMPTGRILLDLMVKLIVVLGVAYGAIYALRGLMNRQGLLTGGRGNLKVLESAALGPNRSIHLVRVGGKVIVVGSTQEQITTLAEVTEPEELTKIQAGDRPFSAHLENAVSGDASEALPLQVRGGIRHVWDRVQEIRGLRGGPGGRTP